MPAAGETLRNLVKDEVRAEDQRLRAQPLPAPAVMTEEAMGVLRAIALNDLAEHKDRVAAAKAILEAVRADEGKTPPPLSSLDALRARVAVLDQAKAEAEAEAEADEPGRLAVSRT